MLILEVNINISADMINQYWVLYYKYTFTCTIIGSCLLSFTKSIFVLFFFLAYLWCVYLQCTYLCCILCCPGKLPLIEVVKICRPTLYYKLLCNKAFTKNIYWHNITNRFLSLICPEGGDESLVQIFILIDQKVIFLLLCVNRMPLKFNKTNI